MYEVRCRICSSRGYTGSPVHTCCDLCGGGYEIIVRQNPEISQVHYSGYLSRLTSLLVSSEKRRHPAGKEKDHESSDTALCRQKQEDTC